MHLCHKTLTVTLTLVQGDYMLLLLLCVFMYIEGGLRESRIRV
jgi:hypothetical protein